LELNFQKTVKLNLIYYPLSTLGPEERIGIWFQGCSFKCTACMSRHTWNYNDGYKESVSKIVKDIRKYNCKNITISGGEPFEQAEELYQLLCRLKKENYEILIYSGYEYKYLNYHHSKILDLVDILIDGLFQVNQETNKQYKGSSNQKMYIFSSNQYIIKKYNKWKNETNKKLQIVNKNDKLYILGIPEIKDTRSVIGGVI